MRLRLSGAWSSSRSSSERKKVIASRARSRSSTVCRAAFRGGSSATLLIEAGIGQDCFSVELQPGGILVKARLGEELVVSSALNQTASIQHQNLVRAPQQA